MDTLAQKRDQVLQNPMGADEILESFNGSQNRTEKLIKLQQVNSEFKARKILKVKMNGN